MGLKYYKGRKNEQTSWSFDGTWSEREGLIVANHCYAFWIPYGKGVIDPYVFHTQRSLFLLYGNPNRLIIPCHC